MRESRVEQILAESVADKEALRRKLREMPIEDKLKLVAYMQRRNNAIRRAAKREPEPEWPWELVGLGPDDPPPPLGSLLDRLGVYQCAMNDWGATEP